MADAEAEAEVQGPLTAPLTRREFLYMLWGTSMAVFMAGAGGATIWFSLPRFREGEFGGVFTIDPNELPPKGSDPADFPEGRFWMVNLGSEELNDPRNPDPYPVQSGIKALYKVCVHLGCLYKWVPTNDRFECPCHGSKYLPTGIRIEGPANRNLDVFIVELLDADGNVISRTEPALDGRDGTAIEVTPEVVTIQIDTGRRVQGAPNSRDWTTG